MSGIMEQSENENFSDSTEKEIFEKIRYYEEYIKNAKSQMEDAELKERNVLLKKRLVYKRFLVFYTSAFVGGLLMLSAYNKVNFTSFLLDNWQSMLGVTIMLIGFL